MIEQQIINMETKKYKVKACPNCKFFNKKTLKCENSFQNTLEEWYENYGRVPQRNWKPDMDLDCYEDSDAVRIANENKEKINDFLSELNGFLKV